MNTTSSLAETLRRLLEQPTGGIVGLVEELLMVCKEHALQLDWEAGNCRVRSISGNLEERIEVPFRKSVFRGILARFAALCNESRPDSVSPYGGAGEFSIGTNSSARFRVVIVNTPTTQKLDLTAANLPAIDTAQQRDLADTFKKLADNSPLDSTPLRPQQGRMGDITNR